jgi:hypothetical protein
MFVGKKKDKQTKVNQTEIHVSHPNKRKLQSVSDDGRFQ